MKNISTFLWFDSEALEATKLYCSIFADARILSSGPTGATFEIAGQRFIAFNGGPHHKLSPAVSVFVPCETQTEIDTLWHNFLAAGSTPSRCGWLTDRYGLSWQIIPQQLEALLGDPDREKANRAMQCMLGMVKLDIAALEAAHRGERVLASEPRSE